MLCGVRPAQASSAARRRPRRRSGGRWSASARCRRGSARTRPPRSAWGPPTSRRSTRRCSVRVGRGVAPAANGPAAAQGERRPCWLRKAGPCDVTPPPLRVQAAPQRRPRLCGRPRPPRRGSAARLHARAHIRSGLRGFRVAQQHPARACRSPRPDLSSSSPLARPARRPRPSQGSVPRALHAADAVGRRGRRRAAAALPRGAGLHPPFPARPGGKESSGPGQLTAAARGREEGFCGTPL